MIFILHKFELQVKEHSQCIDITSQDSRGLLDIESRLDGIDESLRPKARRVHFFWSQVCAGSAMLQALQGKFAKFAAQEICCPVFTTRGPVACRAIC